MSEKQYAAFAVNVKNLDRLRRNVNLRYWPGAVKVEKILVFSRDDFEKLSEDISPEYPFLQDNKHLMSADPGGWFRCLLVTAENEPEGILMAQGSMNLYLAYAKDYRKMDLPGDIPIEHLPLEEPKAYQEKAVFFRDVKTTWGLEKELGHLDYFRVKKVVVLNDREYLKFKNGGLAEEQLFLFDVPRHMYFDPARQCWHCYLVKGETSKDGILAEAEGYSYARYAAYIPDCSRLRLQGVPVQNHERDREKKQWGKFR